MDTITTTASLLKSNGSAQPVTVALMPNEVRLIAAAPDLLEALEDARKFVACPRYAESVRAEALKRVDAAIARAKGGVA